MPIYIYWLKKYSLLFIVFFILLMPVTLFVFSRAIVNANSDSLVQVTGIKRLAVKSNLFKSAMYWHLRSWKNAGQGNPMYWEPIKRVFGNMYSFNRDGTINYTYFEEDRIKYGKGILADVEITDLNGAAQMLLSFRDTPAIVSIYNQDYVLIWIDGKPFNLHLVQRDLGFPAIHPPTSIVDRLFADYYWMLLRKS